MKVADYEDELSWEEIRRVFDYDPSTGIIRWKEVTKYSPAKPADVAGHKDHHGYIRITYRFRRYRAHRLAWKWVHGVWPTAEIDHEDTNRSNNALSNLRPATSQQNNQNASLSKRNTSGFKGVYWSAKTSKWNAAIKVGGKVRWLGGYNKIELAAEAYRLAAEKYFGEFARAA